MKTVHGQLSPNKTTTINRIYSSTSRTSLLCPSATAASPRSYPLAPSKAAHLYVKNGQICTPNSQPTVAVAWNQRIHSTPEMVGTYRLEVTLLISIGFQQFHLPVRTTAHPVLPHVSRPTSKERRESSRRCCSKPLELWRSLNLAAGRHSPQEACQKTIYLTH